MGMNERIYKIDQLLSDRKFISIPDLLDYLGISKATLNRDLALMRDRMHAPIVFDSDLGGYRFDKEQKNHGISYELPGLWFSSNEIHALLTMHYLISNMDNGGILAAHIQPLQSRLTSLLGAADNPADEIKRRVKIRMVGVRHARLEHFEAIGFALLNRKRIQIDYDARATHRSSQREISPQRMIYYQGTWYLDAWCHLRNALRSFSIDAIRRVEILEKKSKDIPDKQLDEILGSGYGIFAGKKVQWATLLFSPEAARWVSNEQWHQDQQGKFNSDGSYELKIPYSQDTELIMDILKYGSRVKVMAPASLINRISKEIDVMKLMYFN